MNEIAIVVMLVVAVVLLPIILSIIALVKASGACRRVEELEQQLKLQEKPESRLKRETLPQAPAPLIVPAPASIQTPSPVPPMPPAPAVMKPAVAPSVSVPPPIPPPAEPEPVRAPINWEQFMGVKMFAWLGGFVLFLGLAFFVKYSFDNNLISPQVRMALGFAIGGGLLVSGMIMVARKFAVLGQTLCATGVVVLYANIFAASGYYHIFGSYPAFGLMVLVTAVAFLLAVRLDAQVVAVLGLLGGFLTPVLINTGKDNPLGLFGYIGLLNVGLLAIVSRKRWSYQVLLAAIGTVFMEWAWTCKFFHVEKANIAMGIFLSMEAIFLAGFAKAQEDDETNPWVSAGTFFVSVMPMVFAFYLLDFPTLAKQPLVFFGFVLAADIGLLLLAVWRERLYWANLVGGGLSFLILAAWTFTCLDNALLNWALGFYFVFAVLHSVFPVVLARLRPGKRPLEWAYAFPALAMLLVIISIARLPEVSFVIWFCVLAIDILVFGLALAASSLLAIIGALVLTLVAAGLWVCSVPAAISGVPELLAVIGGFALVFFAVGVWLAKRPGFLTTERPGQGLPEFVKLGGNTVQAQLPAASVVLPFLLLIMVVVRMPLVNPSPVFGLAMLLVVLLLGVARLTKVDALSLAALVCAAALEYAWHNARFRPENAVVSLWWNGAFIAVFTLFPFLFRREMADRVLPWMASALAGVVHFHLVYQIVKTTWPGLPAMGLLPAGFALPPLLGLVLLARGESAKRLSQLAWFGGATLFFVTLVFPIQFERQWITIGWGLEGAALLWLFHRVPHKGLRWVGVGLLCVAFGRLALNPSVLEYHPRSATAIFNWYLYAYGIVTVCLFVGARLTVGWKRAAGFLAALGTVLAFLLLNIEIADYFTETGARTLTFQFSGNFGRDMTYSIAWALFALVLLVAGIAKKLPAARYASLGLLGVTVLKLLIHDLASLNRLYRIGACVGVAVILLVSSFLYQRFVVTEEKKS